MKLYDKIYEAIDNGIQKALIIDNGQIHDTSVIFQHRKVSNDANMMCHLVSNLLDEDDAIYNYRLIISYYNTTSIRYICSSLSELLQIFKKLESIQNINLEWINFSQLETQITIITEDNNEIPLNEYKRNIKPLFLKISNQEYDDILINVSFDNHLITNNKLWQKTRHSIQDDKYHITSDLTAKQDYSGYETCMRIKNIKNKKQTPAIDYCTSLDIPGYQGYLPSAGQIMIISDHNEIINYILKYIHKPILNMQARYLWWTSSEYSFAGVWILGNNKTLNVFPKNITDSTSKRTYILPLFHKNNN